MASEIEKERLEEIKLMLEKMSLEEKVSLMLYESKAVPSCGIPEYNWWNEALHGIGRAGYATVFPQTIGLAATFDTELALEEYTAISDEARAKYNIWQSMKQNGQYQGLTFWTPNINILRDPRWGRAQETFGEDPYLTSQMGVAAVRGLQGDDKENLKTAACAKHFAVHSGPEKTRHTYNAEPSKKDLWETYLPAFKALVDEGVESVMGAYQRLYGEPCCGSKFLLVDILRNKWNFKGHVVSDCWAIQDFHMNHKVTSSPAESAALAINNGCDLNCGCTYISAVEAVKKGLVSEEKIDESVTRLLMTRFKLGMFDNKTKWDDLGPETIDSQKHRDIARKVAAESVVLLKNKNGLLPLKNERQKIMVMGPAADSVKVMLGNYYGLNSRVSTILEGLVGKLKDRPLVNLDYTPGCGMYAPSKQKGWTLGMAESADVVVACFGLDGMMEGEEGEAVETTKGDRDAIELPEWQEEYLRGIHERGTPVVLVLTGGSAISFNPDFADAILFAWYGGEEGGNAIADVIFGDEVPSGHLPMTFPKSTADLPDFEDYSLAGRTYRFAQKEPLFPFGFGLSYVQWKFDGGVEVKKSEVAQKDVEVKVNVKVENTGALDSACVVQLYVKRENAPKDEPLCTLRKFQKVKIAAGKTAELSFVLDAKDFESFDSDGNAFVAGGKYTIIAGDSSPSECSQKLGAAKPFTATIEL